MPPDEELITAEADRLAATAGQHRAARAFLLSGAAWFFVGTVLGLLSAVQLSAPDLLANIPFLQFGRLRPAHTNAMLLGFVNTTLLGGGLYIVPVLLRTRLHSERLGLAALWLWNLALGCGIIALALGHTQAREYAELIWPVDVAVVIVFVLLLYNLVMTVIERKEKLLYVSVWYFVGAVLWTGFVYPIGNVMWHPATGSMTGVVDAIWLWFYGHNILGLLLTPLAVGAAYYIIPRLVRAPLYSHTLSLVGFWTFISLYSHIGVHHLIQAPVPLWLKVVSIIDSMAMILPVYTVLINLWMTMRGRFAAVVNSVPGSLIFLGTIWYAIVCLQGPFQSLPSVQRITHFTNWPVGHAHAAVFGFTGFIALGTYYYVLPRVCGRELFSWRMANLHYWLAVVGIGGMFAVLTAAGLVQGSSWLNGETVYRVLPTLVPYMALRTLFGVMIMIGAFLGLYNGLMTACRRPPSNGRGVSRPRGHAASAEAAPEKREGGA
jgi:cbb3-type cytochrome c oxidase subunit I